MIAFKVLCVFNYIRRNCYFINVLHEFKIQNDIFKALSQHGTDMKTTDMSTADFNMLGFQL